MSNSTFKQSVKLTWPTSNNYNSKNRKGAITFAERRRNAYMLLNNSTFLMLGVLVK